jgi:hypothetical protein
LWVHSVGLAGCLRSDFYDFQVDLRFLENFCTPKLRFLVQPYTKTPKLYWVMSGANVVRTLAVLPGFLDDPQSLRHIVGLAL